MSLRVAASVASVAYGAATVRERFLPRAATGRASSAPLCNAAQAAADSESQQEARAQLPRNGRRRHLTKRVAIESPGGRIQIRVVEHVISFHAEPEVESLGDMEILRQGRIDPRESGSAERIPSEVSVGPKCGYRKLRYRENPVDQELLAAESGCLDTRQRSIRTIAGVSVGIVVAIG